MGKRLGMLLLMSSLLVSNNVPTVAATLVYDGKAHTYNGSAITLYVNNKKIQTATMTPVQLEGRVLVPARELFEALGARVLWDSQIKQARVIHQNSTILLTVNQNSASKDGKPLLLDVPAKIINNKLMIPVRFISENFGFNVKWDGLKKCVYITESKASQEETDIKDIEPSAPVVDSQDSQQVVQGNQYIGTANKHHIDLPSASYGMAKIMEVTVGESGDENTTLISASSPISSANVQFQAGKIIIDIKNSKSYLNSTITPSANTYIKSIRTSQYTTDTTRVVLDLKAGALVDASFNESRSNILIHLSKQQLEQIQLTSDNQCDNIYFKGLSASQINLEESEDGKILSFNILHTGIQKAIQWTNINSHYISRVTVDNAAKGVQGKIYLKSQANYELNQNAEGTTLHLSEYTTSETSDTNDTYEKVTYQNGVHPAVQLNGIKGVSKSRITVTDDYRNRKLVFDLGADYSSQLKNDVLTINDGVVKQVTIKTNETTKIVITTEKVYHYNLYEEKGKVQLQLVRPKEKFSQIVVLDFGHGGSDSGAVGNGLTEKALNYKQGMALYQLLKDDPNIKVYLTRETDVYPSLAFRSELANDIQADLFVSIHNNSASSNVTGTETLYYPNSSDTRGKAVAQIIQNAIVENCGTLSRGIKARADLYVLRTTNMPAILIETGFISNAAEATLMNTSTFNSIWAEAVYNGILESFKII